MSRRKRYLVDYEIVGTLYLSSPNSVAVGRRAAKMMREAIKDLRDISVYCEEEIATPIDEEERYGVRKPPQKSGGKGLQL